MALTDGKTPRYAYAASDSVAAVSGGSAMRDSTELRALSQFIGALHEVRSDLDGPALLEWSADQLSGLVGFDAA